MPMSVENLYKSNETVELFVIKLNLNLQNSTKVRQFKETSSAGVTPRNVTCTLHARTVLKMYNRECVRLKPLSRFLRKCNIR